MVGERLFTGSGRTGGDAGGQEGFQGWNATLALSMENKAWIHRRGSNEDGKKHKKKLGGGEGKARMCLTLRPN